MKEENKPKKTGIPTSKVQRASKFVKTGAKVGRNYIKHYAKKVVNPNLSNDELDKANAEEVFETLGELKGSALKVAQMLSMQDNILPQAYADKFRMAQNAVPPLSMPLVIKTFKRELGKSPFDVFDSFSKEAINAASIGQVHEANLDGKKLAVKIQYPGVAESVRSDLKMVRPFAEKLLKINTRELDMYMGEVENMLISETDYKLELQRSVHISESCKHLPYLFFPKYYTRYSSGRILTMDFLEGMVADDFMKHNPSSEIRNQIGQALWDFYDYQIHTLKTVHADPHPGNFLLTPEGKVGVIDFGCVKEIPTSYYHTHFQVLDRSILNDDKKCEEVFLKLGFINQNDTAENKAFFTDVFRQSIEIVTRPLMSETFDFSDKAYFQELYDFGDRVAQMEEFRQSGFARGSQHAIYINRAYFGLFFLLHKLQVKIKTHSSWKV